MSPPDSGVPALDRSLHRRTELDDAALTLQVGLMTPTSPAHAMPLGATLRAALRRLRAELSEHITVTEGPGGLYEEVRHADPRLEPAVRRLCGEHARLARMVDELAERAGLADEDPERLGAVRGRASELLGLLGRHRRRDTQLVYDALALDLGGQE
jgi:hypothetical protein